MIREGRRHCGPTMGATVARPKYQGELTHGLRHGRGRMVWADGRMYDGEFRRGLRQGQGTLELANGDQYVGEWQNDQMHGHGTYTSAEEGEYDGHWANGLREGYGKLRLKAGTVYDGGFSQHKYHGQGLLKLKDGTCYEGEFFRGQMQGTGSRTFADGSMYEGEFHQGDCNGKGRWFSSFSQPRTAASGQSKGRQSGWLFDGTFLHGRPVDGEMILPNGEVWHHVYPASSTDHKGFAGQHLDAHRPEIKRHIGTYGRGWDGQRDFNGKMIWKWADGREFRGEFKHGAPVRGRLYDITEQAWYEVEYTEGICISDDRLTPNSKKLAQEEIDKDLAFSKNLEQLQQRLEAEEGAYQQMLKAIEEELEGRILKETKLWIPPSTPPPEEHWEGFNRAISAAHVYFSIRLTMGFHSIGHADSLQRSEFMAGIIDDLVKATGTHERIFRIEAISEGSIIVKIAVLPDPKFQFIEHSPAEIVLFLLEQSKKPLSKFMRGTFTRKLQSIDVPDYVFHVLREEEEARKPKVVVEIKEIEAPPPPPAEWQSQIPGINWQPRDSGIGFLIGRMDLRAAAQYKAQLEAVHLYNMEQLAKVPPSLPPAPTPEPDFLSKPELIEQIRESVAFLYAGATLKNNAISDEERYPTTKELSATGTRNENKHLKGKSPQNGSEGVVRERKDQRRAAKVVLELLGGNPDATLDSPAGWNVEPYYGKKLEQAKLTAELLWGYGGIKALVFVLRGAYPDSEFVEVLATARNEKERERICKASVSEGEVDIRELASECILRACTLNPNNRQRLKMSLGPGRPDGDGVFALLDLLRRGPDGSRERAAAAIAGVCKADVHIKESVSDMEGIQALLELFSTRCPAALKQMEISRLRDIAEGRKMRAAALSNEGLRVTQMEDAQKEIALLEGMRTLLDHRLRKLKESGIKALYCVTTDCHIACEKMLVHGGLKVMQQTIIKRKDEGCSSGDSMLEIESATGIVENVCRSFFQPGVVKETDSLAATSMGGFIAAAGARGDAGAVISSHFLQNLHDEVENLNLVCVLHELLKPRVNVDGWIRIQARAAGALWAIVDGKNLYAERMHRYDLDGDNDYTEQILTLDGMSTIMNVLMYGNSGDQDELEARELTVGLISSMINGNESCCRVAKQHGVVARLMQLMNLGDDGLGAFSTQELAAKALHGALEISEDCRSEARRSGIREMLKTIIESPLLHSPEDLERQQAMSSREWALKLLRIINRAPFRGMKGQATVDETWGVNPATTIQCNFRMHSSRKKLAHLKAMPTTLRQSLLRIENAVTNELAFKTFCALETEEGDGGHLGDRAESMDVHEWVELLKHLSILHIDAEDKHKVSKTQAIAAFKSINADAQQTVNFKKLAPPKELNYHRYQKCLTRISKMLKSEAEALGEIDADEDRTESPLARGVSLCTCVCLRHCGGIVAIVRYSCSSFRSIDLRSHLFSAL